MTENFSCLQQGNRIRNVAQLRLCVFMIALMLPLAARAQDTGYISGTVVDKSGAAVVGAQVVLTNVAEIGRASCRERV